MNGTLFGIPIQQTWSALFMLEKVLTENKFDVIIELGTGNGALTRFLSYFAYVYSFDVEKKCDHAYLNDVYFIYDDIFSKETILDINDTIRISEKTLVFCDNGNKPKELKIYSKFLKPGDHIMVHDYKRPDGMPKFRETKELEFYRQNEFDSLKTYILSLRRTLNF